MVDTIGNETGMHKYDEAFIYQCRQENCNVNLVSNFVSPNNVLLLHNYYHGSRRKRIWYLLVDLFRFRKYVVNHIDEVFVYQSFGFRCIDILFYMCLMSRKKCYLLVHDLYVLNVHNKRDSLMWVKRWFYQHKIKSYVCHSIKVADEIRRIRLGRCSEIITIPHLQYSYDTHFDKQCIKKEVKESIAKNKKNLLFFGQISTTKGIDILIDALQLLKSEIHIIIAGMDKGRLLPDKIESESVTILNRYIADDELNYLFTNVDAVVMPYREIYQSGVFETCVHFRKPAILSTLECFENYKSMYPSFCDVYTPNTAEALAECINSFDFNKKFYNDEDRKKYESNHSISVFLKEIRFK